MTRRFYFANAAAPYTPATIRGTWDATASGVAKSLGYVPAGVAATNAVAEAVTTNLWDVLWGRWVSDPIPNSGSLAGTATWIVGVLESATTANDFFHVHIFVTAGDSDTVRGTLLTNSIGATEFPTTATGRGEGAKTLSAVTVTAGDRIVVEIGYQAQNTSGTSFTGTMNYGNTGTTDLASASTAVTTNPGWIEFSDTNNVLDTIQENSSSPAVVQVTVNTPPDATTASFSPPAESLLVAIVQQGFSNAGPVTCTVSDSGGHTWTAGPTADSQGSFFGLATIHTCYLSTAPGSITVTAAFTGATPISGSQLVLKVLTGVKASQAGAATAVKDGSGAASTAATVNITTTVTGSRVFGSHDDPDTAAALTPNAATFIISDFNDTNDGARLIAWRAATTGRTGVTTLGGTMASADHAHIAALEILPVDLSAQTVSLAGIASEETVAAPTVTRTVKLASVVSDEVFGKAVVTLTIAPAGVPSEERVGNAYVAVAPPALTVAPAGIPSEESAGVTRVGLTVAPAGITSSEGFGVGVVTPGTVTVAPAGIPGDERFGASAVTPGAVTITPASCPTEERLGQPTVTPGAVNLAPKGIPSDETIGAARLGLTIAPAGIRSEESAGNTAVKPVIAPAGIGSTESVGAPQVTLNLAPAGIGTAEALGTPTVTPGAVTLSPPGIPGEERLGAVAVTVGAVTLNPTGIPSGEALGVPSVTTGAVTVSPAGISSDEVVGAAVVTTGALNLAPAGTPSTEQFGSPTVTTGAVTLTPAGIPSDERLGSVTVTSGTAPTQTLNLVGIPGDEAIGNAAVEPGTAYITPPGIPTGERFGAPTVTANLTLAPVGIPSSEQFGSPTVTPGAVTLQPAGIPADELVGAPRLSLNLAVAGIPGDETVGTAQVQLTIHPVGTGSDETFGTPGLVPGAVTIFATAIVSTEEFGQVTVGIFITAWPPHAGAVVITRGASGAPTITNVSADVDITTGPTGAPTTEPVATGDVTASRGATGSLELV